MSEAFAGVRTRAVGAFGLSAGVTGADALLAAESPTALRAFTVNVYAVPFVRPVHAAVVPVTTHETAAGEDVTTYVVIGLPPSLAEAVQETLAVVSAAVAVTPVGALGNPGVVIADEVALGTELPTLFVAITVNV